MGKFMVLPGKERPFTVKRSVLLVPAVINQKTGEIVVSAKYAKSLSVTPETAQKGDNVFFVTFDKFSEMHSDVQKRLPKGLFLSVSCEECAKDGVTTGYRAWVTDTEM